MRLLIVGINFFPELTGIGKYTGEMALFLANRGFDIHVIAAPPYYPHWKVQKPYRTWMYVNERWGNIQIYRCPLWVPKHPSGLKRLLHLASFSLSSIPVLLRQIFWKPDIVMVIVPAIASAPLSLITARLSGAKAWLHVQDFEVDTAFNLDILSSSGLLARSLVFFEGLLLRSFDVVSTISNRMVERLKVKGVAPTKIILLKNWVDTDKIFPLTGRRNPVRKELNIDEDKIVVLYAGNMGEKQGLEVLIDTARRLKEHTNIYFVLCGDGVVRQSIEKQARDLTNVRFIPLQPIEKLNLLLNMADIHVLPQRADVADLVMPSKLIGMLASGKPVVAMARTNTEIAQVIEATGVLIPPENVDALVDALLRLSIDDTLREQLGEQGRKYACDHYGQDIVLEQLQEQLMKLMD